MQLLSCKLLSTIIIIIIIIIIINIHRAQNICEYVSAMVIKMYKTLAFW